MNKETLKQVIVDQKQELEERFHHEKVVTRDGVELCRKYLAHPNLLLISGMRRAGKSFFAHLTAGTGEYAFLNFDDERLMGFSVKDFNTVLECFGELYKEPGIFMFDEIQNIRGWELFVSRLRNTKKVIVTGSNAHLLSKEMSTHLTGRFMEFMLFPMSFKEYCIFKDVEFQEKDAYSTRARSRISALFSEYIQNGGIFDYYKFGPEFLRTVWRSVIDRDIAIRYHLKYPDILEQMALILLNSFASKVSGANLTRHFKLKSAHTVNDYIRYIENVFLMFSINKFSYKVKEQFTTFKKMYVMDNGFIRALSFSFSENRGRMLENMVAVELMRRCIREGSQLFYWDDYHFECDFVVKKGTTIESVYQVCAEVGVTNREREIKGLVSAAKEFGLKKARILTFSQDETFHANGCVIEIMPVWRWLLHASQAPLGADKKRKS
jgi:hypothetical protein